MPIRVRVQLGSTYPSAARRTLTIETVRAIEAKRRDPSNAHRPGRRNQSSKPSRHPFPLAA